MGSVNTVKRKVNRGGWTKRYGRANEGATGSREGSGRSSEQVGKGYREKKIDKSDKTMRTSATVSIDGRREETKPNSMGSEEGERGGKGF